MLFVIAQTLAFSLNSYFSDPSCSKQLNRLKYHGTLFVLIPLNLGLSPTLLPTTRFLNLGIFLKSSSEFPFLFFQGTVATEMDFKWKTKMVKYFKLFSLASFYIAFFVWTKHLVSISGFMKRVVEYAETKRLMTSEKQEGFYQNKFESSLTFIQRPGN